MRGKLSWTLAAGLIVAFGGLAATLIAGFTPALGLDLQGGLSVTQQPVGAFSAESLELAEERIRDRVDSLGIAEPEILRQGDAIVVNLPGVQDAAKAIDLVQVSGKVSLRPALSPCNTSRAEPVETTTTVANASSTTPSTAAGSSSAPSTTAAGGPSRQPQAPPDSEPVASTSVAPPSSAAQSTTSGVTSTTVVVEPTEPISLTIPTSSVPFDPDQLPDVAPEESGIFRALGDNICQLGPEGATGEVFEDDATASIGNGGWQVTVSLKRGAGEGAWNALAAQCATGSEACPTRQLAIVLDDTVQSAPSVNDTNFAGSVQITGSFTEQEARELASVINSGSLPVELVTESIQNVSPTLGKDSLRAVLIAGFLGVGLVLLFVAFYYRTLGLIAFAGLCVSAALVWTVISLLSRYQGLALSLSGIAGIIVSVGVTIDSYVVFFERLKDEVRAGRTVRNSASRAFSGAWRTIVVADLVSFIGAITLWVLTVGSFRNFAFFLGLSTLCDLVVSYFFTRPAALLLARTTWMSQRKVMGIEAQQGAPA
jgi:preprotein translocase subunit SecD